MITMTTAPVAVVEAPLVPNLKAVMQFHA
jgi:hypothetical protein